MTILGANSRLSVVILTYNSEASLGRTLKSVVPLTDDIHVVDSFSTDRTLEICAAFSATIHQRPFLNYSDQRNWAIDSLPLKHDWQLHVDADEEISAELAREIAGLDLARTPYDGFEIGRKIVFLGKVLRFGGIAKTWHYRLFRSGHGRCEDRLYDQHFLARGRVSTINSFMLDHQEATLSSWTQAHNRWSDMEAAEMSRGGAGTSKGQVAPSLVGSRIERKRYFKSAYYRMPIFARALSYFLYRYLVRLGCLDGAPGLIFHFLQGFWFRFLVDAKIYELRRQALFRLDGR